MSMMSKKMKFDGPRDLISDLPEALIGHILSFLPTKEAASTSVLAKKWRYLFALTPNLAFDDGSVYVIPTRVVDVSEMVLPPKRHNVSPSFMDFVDRVLALQGNSPVHKFSLVMEDGDDPVDPNRVLGWILNVLERGASDLDLDVSLEKGCLLPPEIFLNKNLVRMTLTRTIGLSPIIDVEEVYLPNVKTLHFYGVYFYKDGVGLAKLLSGCHMLEDLILSYICWLVWDFASVSVPTLKRLKFCREKHNENPKSLSFDTPNLVYLEFSDSVAVKYPKVNFGSLAEAKIDLRMALDLQELEILNVEEKGNATEFIMGICNVKILCLSADTLEVLTYCCEALPRFNNLKLLTIESSPRVGWQSLPGLLKNSPNLETLVLRGLVHKATNKCGVVCLCKPYEEEDETDEISTCLSSSPVKVLKIMKFGDDKLEKQIEQVKLFLEMMPNLEQMTLYYDTAVVEDVTEVSSQLRTVDKVASSKCNVQLISSNLNVPSSITMTLP